MGFNVSVGGSLINNIDESITRNNRQLANCRLPHDFKPIIGAFNNKHMCTKCKGEVIEKELYKYIDEVPKPKCSCVVNVNGEVTELCSNCELEFRR